MALSLCTPKSFGKHELHFLKTSNILNIQELILHIQKNNCNMITFIYTTHCFIYCTYLQIIKTTNNGMFLSQPEYMLTVRIKRGGFSQLRCQNTCRHKYPWWVFIINILAEWSMCLATNQQVTGSIPRFFTILKVE